jgi:hypothetical protein
MKRQIVIKLFGDEIVNVFIEESEDETEESEEESVGGSTANIETASTNKGSIGFNTPWSVEYWDEEE